MPWCIVGNRKFVEIDRAIRALPEPGWATLRDCHRMIPVVALAPLTPFARRTARSGRRGEESPSERSAFQRCGGRSLGKSRIIIARLYRSERVAY